MKWPSPPRAWWGWMMSHFVLMVAASLLSAVALVGLVWWHLRWVDVEQPYEHDRDFRGKIVMAIGSALSVVTGVIWVETVKLDEFNAAAGGVLFLFVFIFFGVHTIELWRTARLLRQKRSEEDLARYVRRVERGDPGPVEDALRAPGDTD